MFHFHYSCQGRQNCVNYYSTSMSADGCFFNFLKLNAAMCCALEIVPKSSLPQEDGPDRPYWGRDDLSRHERFRAVELSVPNVVAEFKGARN